MTTVELAAPYTPEWFAARRKGIGASEIAAVMGISPWESPLSLYWRKVNGWELEATEEMRTGTILEPAIAQWGIAEISDRMWEAVDSCPAAPLMAEPECPWILATPDRLIRTDHPSGYGTDLVAVLECKWTGSWDGWGEEGTDAIPVYYRTQVLWQCLVVNVDRWYLAVLGPSGFRLYRGRYDAKDLAVMVEHGRRFMQRLADGDPPPLDDHHATITTLRRLHPELVDEQATVPDRIAEGYLRAVRMEKLAETTRKRYEALIRDAAGSARTVVSESGRKVATHVIADVAAETQPRGPHRKDYLLAPRPRKKSTP